MGSDGRRNHVLNRWGGPAVLRDVVMHGNQFWDAICCNWLVGYKFGCMIASDTLFDSKDGFSGSSYLMKT